MLNLNVGLLGHVDSGKTSLARALSQTASTACFDKNPQSQERGITLDLGFSSRVVRARDGEECALKLQQAGVEQLQITFVDCPGHASLMRTIVGGAQIIDVMILVIDATKGVQAQTAECLVLGEVLNKPMLVVINKIDALPGSSAEKQASLQKLRKRLIATFATTRWHSIPIVAVAADPRSEEGRGAPAEPQNIDAIIPALLPVVDLGGLKTRENAACTDPTSEFMMLIDHCFAVRGQGTVFTGTIAAGRIRVGEHIWFPEQQLARKVKGLQVFRQPVEQAGRGDRVGLCVGQFDPSMMERGIACAPPPSRGGDVPGGLDHVSSFIARVHRVRFHQLPCDTQTKFHITVGHTTVMGSMRFFSRDAEPACPPREPALFDVHVESRYEEELGESAVLRFAPADPTSTPGMPAAVQANAREYFAIVLLERELLVPMNATFVAMRLDLERENVCRLALTGKVVAFPPPGVSPDWWRELPIVRLKRRDVHVDRVLDARTCIATGFVSSQVEGASATRKPTEALHAEIQKFIGLKVMFEADEIDGEQATANIIPGVVHSAFGKTGKAKVCFDQDVFAASTGKSETPKMLYPGTIVLTLKKFPLALHSAMQQ